MDRNIVHGLSSKEDALASRKSIIHRFNVPVSVVSEPKPECDPVKGTVCDHIVGIVLHEVQVTMSEITGWGYNIKDEMLDDNGELVDSDNIFYFCPKKGCGAPIDWDDIVSKLNT